MPGILDNLKTFFQNRNEKEQNRPFLEATMAACAMVSVSEGQVSFADRIRTSKDLSSGVTKRSLDFKVCRLV